MRALNLVLLDIRNGISTLWHSGLLSCALFLLMNLTLYRLNETMGEQLVPMSLGDYYVNMFTGIKNSEFRPDRLISLPFMWLAILSSILYFTLNYPHKDLEGIGKYFIVLSGNRLKWWGSKCLWVFLVVLLFFLIWLTLTIVWLLLIQGSLKYPISSNILIILGLELEMMVQPPWPITVFVVVTFFTVLALCLFQMFLSLCLRPILAFMTSTAILLLSVYFMNPFLLGNYLMATRSNVFVLSGVNSITGILVSFGIILVVIIGGGWYFKHMDLLIKED